MKEGRFPHPNKCDAYVECVKRGVGGSLTPRDLNCPGWPYDPRSARCVTNQQAPWCDAGDHGTNSISVGGREMSHSASVAYPVRSPKHDQLCMGEVGFACASCVESVVCAGSEAFLQACPASTRCVQHENFPGGVCYPYTSHNPCVCHSAGVILPDLHDPTAFLLCQDTDGDPQVIYCSDNHEFDADTLTCLALPTFPRCAADGVFPVVADCRWYYRCVSSASGGWQRQHGMCPLQSQVYSQELGRCNEPDTLPIKDPCSKKQKATSRYTCTLWQLLLVILFPQYLASICSP
ncbi:uncharacterized protein [Panulirus ornatus]|uniref:uncharacterized protein n=1 Tax=Panulirus ornatus TaxID=150431 RepID=UPI003A86FF94